MNGRERRAYMRRWRRRNRDKIRAQVKRWRAANPGYDAEWRRKNPDKEQAKARRYYTRHRERIRKREREKWLRYGDKYREKHRQWYAANRERASAIFKRYNVALRENAMRAIAARWGDSEPRCRKDTLPKRHPLKSHSCYGRLSIDHMNGDGAKDYKSKYKAPTNFYRAVVKGDRH